MNESAAESTGMEGPKDSLATSAAPVAQTHLVTLLKCETLLEADAVRTRLEAANIKCFLPDEGLMQNVAWGVNTYGYIRVQVHSADCAAAKEVLASMQEAAAETTDEPGVKRAEIPLPGPMKAFAFVMPLFIFLGLLMFAVARGAYLRQGCDRKARQLWHWFAGGFAFWVIALIVLASLR